MKLRPSRMRGSLLAMVLISLALQLTAMTVLRTYKFRSTDNNFNFGWEMGRIGQALAQGEGFSSPYGGHTGPSVWEPPLYPYLIGGVFKLFGVYSHTSAWMLLALNSVFAALTCIPIFLMARETMGEKVAVWSAWVWVLLPYEIYWSIRWVWDTTLSPLLLGFIFLVSLRLAKKADGRRWWIVLGALWGMTALTNPSFLSFAPFCLLWIWHRRRARRCVSVGGIAWAIAVMAVCMAPWLVRNYATFGEFVFIRGDFGQQLRLGNGPGADGMLMGYLQPNLNAYEMDRFSRMGELRYAEERKREALEFIREDPGRFVAISAKRFVYYWAGYPKPGEGPLLAALRNSLFLASSILTLWGLVLAIRKKKPGAGLFALLVISYPTAYYVVFPHARYRHPIEPELMILAVFLLLEARGRRVAESRAEAYATGFSDSGVQR